MPHAPSSYLTPWANFYVMTGSSAAALTGLMFVVITLVTGADRSRRTPEGTAIFSTPTVLHFGAALFVSATMSAPWDALIHPSLVLGFGAICGVVYVLRVAVRIDRLEGYSADIEDRLCHTVLPLVSYCAMLVGAWMLPAHAAAALFAVAAAVATLIFTGIHNAWDIVTFIAVAPKTPPDES